MFDTSTMTRGDGRGIPKLPETWEEATCDSPAALSSLEVPTSPHLVWDLETIPAWESDEINDAKAYCQPLGIDFDPDSVGPHPGEFDVAATKHRVSKAGGGRLTDPKKIDEAVAKKELEHIAAVDKWKRDRDEGHDQFWRKIQEKSTLSPLLSRVCAVGYLQDGEVAIEEGAAGVDGREFHLINCFFRRFENCVEQSRTITGWNITAGGNKAFDLPCILTRAAKLGVEIPQGIYQGRYSSPVFVDLMDRWFCGFNPWKQKDGSVGSAKDVARFLGCHRPDDEIEGKDFWRYWIGTPGQRKLAERYLSNDVIEEGIIARALGVI